MGNVSRRDNASSLAQHPLVDCFILGEFSIGTFDFTFEVLDLILVTLIVLLLLVDPVDVRLELLHSADQKHVLILDLGHLFFQQAI